MEAGAADPYGREGLPLTKARQQILASIRDQTSRRTEPSIETVALDDALERVNAATVLARADVPGFRASIMDGYALGQRQQPAVDDTWRLVGRSAPADPYTTVLAHGEAIRILTGAPLPEGADWVLPQELVQRTNDSLCLKHEASANPWIRPANEECSQGSILLKPGQHLGLADLAQAASCGVQQLDVYRQPRIGLLISGDELVPPGEQRPKGAIWESNSTLLKGLLRRLGYQAWDCRVVADQPHALRETILELSACCDVLVSTGGVSAGDSDWIRPLMTELGEVDFWKLFLKPGRPFAFGWVGTDVPFFGLPGNPVAAAITALQLLWPALQVLEGQQQPELLPRLRVNLETPYRRRPGRPELARASLICTADGQLRARIDGSQASSRIGSLQNADLLLEIPAESGELERGDQLWAQLLRRRML